MKRRDFVTAAIVVPITGVLLPECSWAADQTENIMAFGHKGGKKMLYDNRQRPQAVYLNGKVFIGYKGNSLGAVKANNGLRSGGGIAYTLLISYDPATREFSKPVQLGKPTTDHHYCPIVWADNAGHLHVLHGCHREAGTHLISKKPGQMGQDESSGWIKAQDIAPGISYPTLFQV